MHQLRSRSESITTAIRCSVNSFQDVIPPGLTYHGCLSGVGDLCSVCVEYKCTFRRSTFSLSCC